MLGSAPSGTVPAAAVKAADGKTKVPMAYRPTEMVTPVESAGPLLVTVRVRVRY